MSNGLDPRLGPLKAATSKEIGWTNRQHCITTLGLETLHNLILTSTKNASLIITDFLAMIKENEQ